MLIYFKTWIKQFKKENTRFGDLARDIQSDESFPRKNNYEEMIDYLKMGDASSNAIDTFKDAWKSYQNNT